MSKRIPGGKATRRVEFQDSNREHRPVRHGRVTDFERGERERRGGIQAAVAEFEN